MKNYIKLYTMNWNNEESDSLHISYSYDKETWYELNGNNGVLFAEDHKGRMAKPAAKKCADGGYCVFAEDAKDSSRVYFYKTKDFINYSEEKILSADEATGYKEASDILEISDDELSKLQNTWGKPEPVNIVGQEEITVQAAVSEKVKLPEKVKVVLSNGGSEIKDVEWDAVDTSKAGEITVAGRVYEHIYTNPIIYHRADPFVYKHTDGNYYFSASYTDMDHNLDGKYQYIKLILRKAASLEGLADGSGEYAEKVIYERKPLPGDRSPHIWAPEIHFIDGKWYVYFTTVIDENEMWSIRPHVLECDGDPMTTEWKNLGQIQKTTEDSIAFTDFSLDHTVLQHKGELYFFWAEKHPVDSDIYAAKMINPWTIDSSRICKVVSPTYNWERHGFPVCEGPGFLVRHGKIFMTYSASGTDALYCLGMLVADEDADLLDEKSWTKSPYPVFQSSHVTGQFGPGHNSFTVDEEGNDVIVYHARQEERYLVDEGYQPLYDAGRNTTLMKIFWNPDGSPNFSVPIPSGKGRDIPTEVKATVIVK